MKNGGGWQEQDGHVKQVTNCVHQSGNRIIVIRQCLGEATVFTKIPSELQIV